MLLKEEKKWNENLGDTIHLRIITKIPCHTIFLDMVQLMNKLGYDQSKFHSLEGSF